MVSSALVISSIPAVLLFGSLNLLAVALAKRAVSVAVLSAVGRALLGLTLGLLQLHVDFQGTTCSAAAGAWGHLPSALYDGEDLSTPQGCRGKQEEPFFRAKWGAKPALMTLVAACCSAFLQRKGG